MSKDELYRVLQQLQSQERIAEQDQRQVIHLLQDLINEQTEWRKEQEKESVKGRSQRIKEFIDKSPVGVFLVIAVFFISSFFTILQGVSWSADLYSRTANWRSIEYNKIGEVKAGMNSAVFDQEFGLPEYTYSDSNLVMNLYKGRDYWVETGAKTSGEVEIYSVLSCDLNFRPKIASPFGNSIVMQSGTLYSFGNTIKYRQPSSVLYHPLGVSISPQIIEYYSSLRQSFYKSVFVGFVSWCPGKWESNSIRFLKGCKLPGEHMVYPVLTSKCMVNLRSAVTINLYAETAPDYTPSEQDEFSTPGIGSSYESYEETYIRDNSR